MGVIAGSLGGEALSLFENDVGIASQNCISVQIEDTRVLDLLPHAELGGHVPPALALVLAEVQALV
eukprot:scaffold298898_cov33-Tisochrysis_lutea.AAC.2